MTKEQQDTFMAGCRQKRLWSFGSKEWPKVLEAVRVDLGTAKELAALSQKHSDMAHELSHQIGNTKTALEKSQETVNSLEDALIERGIEIDQLKAVLAKTKSELTLAEVNEEKHKNEYAKARGHIAGLIQWIYATHRLPTIPKGIRAVLAGWAKVSTFVALLLPMICMGQFPPPFWRNAWTTNVPPRAVTGQDNLSVTNLGSTTNWLFYEVGPKTIARLGDVTNIASAFAGGDAGGTNARQFGTLVLTNLSGNLIPYTNIILPDVGIALGTNAGITYITNTINTNAFQPASGNLTNWANIPTGAMANVVSTTFLTNWANSISNLTQTKQNGTSALTNLSGNPNVATNILGSGFVTVSSNNAGTWTITGAQSGETNFNGEVSITNATRIGLVNGKSANTNLLRSVQGGNGIVLTNEGTNVMFAIDPAVVASQADLTTASNTLNTAIINATNSASVTNWINFRQPASTTLSNLSGTGAITNLFNNSLSNATIKPTVFGGVGNASAMTNTTGQLYGLEAGTGITLTPNGSNISVSAAGALTTNGNQFLGVPLSIMGGASLTNTVHWESNALLPALIATNQPGGTIDLVTMLTTNAAGLRVTSNGAVVVHGVIGSSTNFFEVRHSNNVDVPFAVSSSNLTRIVGPSQSGVTSPTMIIDSLAGSSENNIEYYVGGTRNARMQIDNSGNVSLNAFGILSLGGQNGIGDINISRSGAGDLWLFRSDSSVALLEGQSTRRNIITNIWDLYGRTNAWFSRTNLTDGLVVTNDIRFLGHNVASNALWVATNSSTGEGEWRQTFQPASTTLTNLSGTGAITNIYNLSLSNNTIKPTVFGGVGTAAAMTNTTGQLYGLEAGNNMTLSANGSNIVLTANNTVVSGASTNANQFGPAVPLTIKDGAFFTNVITFPTGAGTAPALTITNVPGLGTNSFQILNSNGQAVIFALTNNGMTLVASNLAILGPQTNTERVNILGGVTNWAAFQVKGTTDHAGSITNEGRMDTAGGVTNWIQSETKGTLYGSSNILVKAGQSTSNAWVGGTVWFDQTGWTNLNGAGTITNLATNIVAAHVLTNNGDAIHAMWRIKLQNSAANTNQFQIVYGSITVLDTGLQLCSNSTCQADLWVTRTGNTAQHADARFEWGPGSGAPFGFTNNNIELAETNGIATIFQLKGGARRVGAHTNNWTRVWYDPAIH